jgi:hypothetical protein
MAHDRHASGWCAAMSVDKKYNLWVKKEGMWVPLIGQYENGRPMFDMGHRERYKRLAMSLDDARKWALLLADQDPRITDHGSPRPTD